MAPSAPRRDTRDRSPTASDRHHHREHGRSSHRTSKEREHSRSPSSRSVDRSDRLHRDDNREMQKRKRKLKKKLFNQLEDPEGPHVREAQLADSGLEPTQGKKNKKRRSETAPFAGVEHEEPSQTLRKAKKKVVEGEETRVEGSKEEAVENGAVKEASALSTGRFTISIAVAGSIVDNAQSFALASGLAGQIARAAAIFRIDEIVVFDDGEEGSRAPRWSEDESETSGTFLTRLLKYMETPQYLRQTLFPRHSSLQFAGSLPPLDVPHQARKHEWIPYREGAVTSEPPPSDGGCCVNVGLYKDVVVRQKLEPGTRVTVKMGDTRHEAGEARILEVVPKSEPREHGRYWGYTVRHTASLSTAISDSPYPNGYDYIIGTSEHGEKIRSAELTLPNFKHILIVFGGVAGLEESKELDKAITVSDVRHLFNLYLNVCPGQGSRTIRTEEAILISLQYLQDPLMRALGLSFSSWSE